MQLNPFIPIQNKYVFYEELKQIAQDIFDEIEQKSNSFSSFMYNSSSNQLPSLLHMEDRVSMAHSVETRFHFVLIPS